MATNMGRSGFPDFQEQKRKLHLILLSRGEGYTTVPEILRDFKNEYGYDGTALARVHGFHSFHTFLESASMREYCKIADEPRTTTVYYGIGNDQTRHIEREMQLSLPAELEKAKKEIRKLRRQLDAIALQPNERSALPIRGFVSANLTVKTDGLLPKQTDSNYLEEGVQIKSMDVDTNTQIDCKTANEKFVQTEDLIPHEIFATLKFLYEPHAKGQIIDRRKDPKLLYSCTRTVPLQYCGNITVKEMIAGILSKHPIDDSIHKYESHTVRFFDPTFNGHVEVSGDIPVVPKGKYIIELNLQEDNVPHNIFATLKCLSKRYAKDEIINRREAPSSLYNSITTVDVAYRGSMKVKDVLAKIRNNHPTDVKLQELKNFEMHTVRYFEPNFNGKDYVNVSGDSLVVPNGKYILELQEKPFLISRIFSLMYTLYRICNSSCFMGVSHLYHFISVIIHMFSFVPVAFSFISKLYKKGKFYKRWVEFNILKPSKFRNNMYVYHCEHFYLTTIGAVCVIYTVIFGLKFWLFIYEMFLFIIYLLRTSVFVK